MSVLELQKLRKTFFPGTVNEKTALRDLSLTLEEGDFVTVIGGNGAGKSTMLNAIAHGNRLIMLFDGRVILDIRGEEKKQLTVERLLEKFGQASGSDEADDTLLLS